MGAHSPLSQHSFGQQLEGAQQLGQHSSSQHSGAQQVGTQQSSTQQSFTMRHFFRRRPLNRPASTSAKLTQHSIRAAAKQIAFFISILLELFSEDTSRTEYRPLGHPQM